MSSGEQKAGAAPAIVPSAAEIRAMSGLDAIEERAIDLTASDKMLVDALKPRNLRHLNPFTRILMQAHDNSLLMDTAVPAYDEDYDVPDDEFQAYFERLVAGRVKDIPGETIEIAEEECFGNLVSYIVDKYFGGRLETFDPQALSARDYGDMIKEIGEALVTDTKDIQLKYDDAEGDEAISDFATSLGAMTTLALASGSRLAIRSAKDYLAAIRDNIVPADSTQRREAVAIERLYNRLIKGEVDQDGIASFKAGLEQDWQTAFALYCSWGNVLACQAALDAVDGKNLFDQRMADQIERIYTERFGIMRDIWLLALRREELLQPAPGTIEESLTHEELIAQLDWTVLPKGEAELEKAAREIVAGAQARLEQGKSVEIQLERLNILKNLRDYWGADRAYYARGTLNGRGKVSVNGEDRPDEYIVLVLQDIAPNGEVMCEHAIAESPIAGPNAIYVLRGDVTTELGWRKIYSLSKKRARELGARRVKHTKGDGSPQVDMLSQRLTYLLSCSPEEFARVEFSGGYVRIARQIGKSALA